ncbi:general transcription factor II-I repeat domain-containing protein 2-like [Myzus persicae]|uniref:general transcription factor II-I repeat domain-containing protein 2-like n=1 Tax=Myzus persicae TaxID=13164 RepID=UPI000B930E7C|nr:general transcription factor II-I repeat domain-containing protein 2-like [Myzus persicae]
MNPNKKCKTYHFNQKWELEFFFVDIKDKCVCLLCRDTLSIFKRGNIERHYRTKHADFDLKFPTDSSLRKDKLKTMKLKLNQEQSVFKNTNKLAQNVTIASFKVAYLLTKKKKPFSDGELIKEAFKEASDSLFTDFKNKSEIVGAISSMQLSSNTVMRRIGAISSNQKTQLQTDLSKCSYFSLQMDESNDMIDTAQLSIFIRMCFDDFSVKEEFLKVLSLTGRTRGENIYKTFKQFVEEEEIPIEKLVSITTDGAPSFCGNKKGFLALCKNDNSFPHFFQYHCIIHQQALCGSVININNVMELVVKIVNSIRGKALKRRLFRELMDEVDCHYGDLLLHSNVRWLSKELQGKEKQIINMISDVQAFSSKLAYWENKMKNGDFQHFPTLQETIINYSENIYEPTNHINIIQHLRSEFKRRFNDFKILEPVAQFISNPFSGDVETRANEIGDLFNLDKTVLEMEIITLQNDSILKITSEFWKHASAQKYPNLRSIALRVTSFFGSTWLCESTFSSMKYLKNKYRSRITDSNLDSS